MWYDGALRFFVPPGRRGFMDPFAMIYYAVVCAALSAVSPRFRTLPWRLVAGAVVGVVAAGLLPTVVAALR